MKHSRNCRFVMKATASLILLMPLVIASGLTGTQDPTSSSKKELPLTELLRLPGNLIAEQSTAQAVGNVKLTGYRVEELRLRQPIGVELRGQQIVVDRAWRITVKGGPFPVRALPAVIWIDDQIAGYGIENETLSQITTITFDGDLIRNGAVISLSYGEEKDSRVKIAQGLQLKRGGANR
jgi:hypothetical protein